MMANAFAQLKINPFADDVVTEPRRVSYSVEGLNKRPLEQLIERFQILTIGELPRKPVVDRKAQLVVSPDRGYGKSHLLGRLFQSLGEQATLIYLRPFQDAQRVWTSILLATIQELERPDQQGSVGSQLEALSKGVLAHVGADHMARGPAIVYPEVQQAVKDLREQPLKVLGQPGNVLINWMKSRLDDKSELASLAQLLRQREVNVGGRETAWLRVLAGYAFTAPGSLEREAALKWLRAEPLEDDEMTTLNLAAADNEARGDASAEEINDLSFRRVKGLCALASYYRPLVFCFDQTEFYGGDKALVHALGRCIWDFHFSIPNHLTIVTTNSNNWSNEVLPLMERALRNRFEDEMIMLEGITPEQAQELIGKRLRDFQIGAADILSFIGDGWLAAQFSGLPQIGVRDVLMRAASRFRSLATPDARPAKTALPDLFTIELNTIRANEALHQYNQDCLMWFAEALAEGYEGVAIHGTVKRYFTVQWEWPDRSTYFAFEAGDHHARWIAIAKEAIALADAAKGFRAIVFRTPDLKPIPRPTWGAAKAHINDAQKKGLSVVALSLDEVCELHAARELYSNALQGNIDYDAGEVLQWLKTHFEPWFKNHSQSARDERPSEAPPPAASEREKGEPPNKSSRADLTEAELNTVLTFVSQRMLVDINEVLMALGPPDEFSQDGSVAGP